MPANRQDLFPQTIAGKDGLALAADRGGPEDAQPVVLMHGGGQTRRSWRSTALRIVRLGYHVISLDLRGHGDSEWSENGRYGIEDFLADFDAVSSTLPRPPVVIGASLGGLVGLLAAGGPPRCRPKSLMLIDISMKVDSAGSSRVRDFMTAGRDGFASLTEAVSAVQAYSPRSRQRSSPEGIMRNLRPGDDGRLYWHWDPAFISGDAAMNAADVERLAYRAARQVTIPTLLVRGALSDVLSVDDCDEFMAFVPTAEVVTIASTGHMIVGTDNTEFDRVIERFLLSHTPA